MLSNTIKQLVFVSMIILCIVNYSFSEERIKSDMEARLEKMEEKAPNLSLTVFPVLVNQIEIQNLVPGLAEVMAMFFEGTGIKKIKMSKYSFIPSAPEDVEKIAYEFGDIIKRKLIDTDYAVFAEFIGTQQSGPDKIVTIVVDYYGDPVWIDVQEKTDELVQSIKQYTPLTCCYVSVEKLRLCLGLIDPVSKDAVKGEWSKYFREKTSQNKQNNP
ncbi:hypothetical protein KAS42_06625 [bacterium]|nr:hypothetical protein [bacterium]